MFSTKLFEKGNTDKPGLRARSRARAGHTPTQPSNIASETVTKEVNVADDSCHRLSETEAKGLGYPVTRSAGLSLSDSASLCKGSSRVGSF